MYMVLTRLYWMLFVGYMGQFNKNFCDSESIEGANVRAVRTSVSRMVFRICLVLSLPFIPVVKEICST